MLSSLQCLITNVQFLSGEFHCYTFYDKVSPYKHSQRGWDFFSHSWVVGHVGGLAAASHLMHDGSSFLSWCLARIFPRKLPTSTHVSSRMGILSHWIKQTFEMRGHSAFWSIPCGGESTRPGNHMLHAAFHRLQFRNIIPLWPQGVTLLVKPVNFMAELRKNSIWIVFLI